MSIFDNIKMALEGLKLNKMRSFLTMLGIIIGIASVIAILTIGQAMTRTVSEGFDSFSKNLVDVMLYPKDGYDWVDISQRDFFTTQDVENVKRVMQSSIESAVIQTVSLSGRIKPESGSELQVNVNSMSNGAEKINNLTMLTGRFYTQEDVEAYRDVCVISDTVAQKVFGGYAEALGQDVEVTTGNGIYVYRCVGVYKNEPISFGAFGGQDDVTTLYIPYNVGARDHGGGNETFTSFVVVTRNNEQVGTTATNIEKYFNEGKYADNEITTVSAETLDSQLQQINDVMNNVQLAIGGIAAISLLVGGIGVMNILLVSVTERTREIGVRKALGATARDIRGQFITESIIICIIGGIIGVLLGGALGYFASNLMGKGTLPDLFSIVLAVGFSMSIGIFFGYYPANKAAKLNPIDALRYE
ncbi:ABC transporter permease [Peptoniphilus equinus]|uniref:ABC transporter permease n=1 Tax=Peptoniphilus equinus TaxID=3016343 RepID=A0ABY7QU05_9FIRM|nr:ABC transporter permease [Peptoniphilus equinus]WBW50256.1 ABC transporter permease [Peptoniphilus equinus]